MTLNIKQGSGYCFFIPYSKDGVISKTEYNKHVNNFLDFLEALEFCRRDEPKAIKLLNYQKEK